MPKKRDLVFLLALCSIGLILTLMIYMPASPDGNFLELKDDGKITAVYPLTTDITIKITITSDPEEYNLLQIKDGIASIIEANCKDKLCIHQKSISRKGESIICLPHRLSVTVTGEDQTTPDAITS